MAGLQRRLLLSRCPQAETEPVLGTSLIVFSNTNPRKDQVIEGKALTRVIRWLASRQFLLVR
jgi:hypothetical protein